jgi:hypothetical protein
MLMPEASVHEDGGSRANEDHIGLPRQFLHVQPVA